MIGLSCTAGAVLALCGQVRGTLERKGLPQKELDGGRVRIEPRSVSYTHLTLPTTCDV